MIKRLVERFARRRSPGRYGTESELAVLRWLTSGDDSRLVSIRRQLERAPRVVREYPAVGYFKASPYAVYDADTFPLEVERTESQWLSAVDGKSGRGLEFRIVVLRHGFLGALEGRTVDGFEWPRDWRVDPAELAGDGPFLELPPERESLAFQEAARQKLSRWLGQEVPASFEMRPPPSNAALSRRELDIGGAFPAGYREFLAISDGIYVEDIHVFGHLSAYPLDNVGFGGVVIELASDDTDDFAVVLRLGGTDETVYRMNMHDDHPKAVAFASSLREYIQRVTRYPP